MMETSELTARLAARARQAGVEQERLNRHHHIASDLLSLPDGARETLIANARAVVGRWQAERLCSVDYVERWTEILSMTASGMTTAIVSDAEGWSNALRQNSPFVGVHRPEASRLVRDELKVPTLVKIQADRKLNL